MPECEFSESDFENALIDELKHVCGERRIHFKPSRSLENSIGHDFGCEMGCEGLGHRNTQHIFDHWNNPYYKFKIDKKQCRRLASNKGSQKHTQHIFDHWNNPYYKFKIDKKQCRRLASTKDVLGTLASVNYAAPCFFRFAEIDGYSASSQVAQWTHFQSPFALADHEIYTYTDPSTAGRVYSEPTDVPPSVLLNELADYLHYSESIRFAQHIIQLWQRLQQIETYSVGVHIEAQDIKAAKLALGQSADLLLDPLNLLTDGDRDTVASATDYADGPEPSLLAYGSIVFCIQRLFRTELGCK